MKRGHVPLRTCRGCGCKRPQKELRRLVLIQGNLVEKSKSTGRAVYCCPLEMCLGRLQKNKKILKQAFRFKD